MYAAYVTSVANIEALVKHTKKNLISLLNLLSPEGNIVMSQQQYKLQSRILALALHKL